MDLKGSLVDTNLRIYPSESLKKYLDSLKDDKDTPPNVVDFINGKETKKHVDQNYLKKQSLELTRDELEKLNKIKETLGKTNTNKTKSKIETKSKPKGGSDDSKDLLNDNEEENENSKELSNVKAKENDKKPSGPYLTTQDMDWLYTYLQKRRSKDKNTPYLHQLLEGSRIEMPENAVIKRNPDLEARCVKLRAQQEAREYRKMTKGVDNVRIRFPEDSISYQLKQINRQLIAIGQFIISIFAGFLFGFRGIEWMVGTLDMGFRMLLGVMCALVIALAEIYFLAKKLNEEMSIPETIQLGGPPKFADSANNPNYKHVDTKKIATKEHQE